MPKDLSPSFRTQASTSTIPKFLVPYSIELERRLLVEYRRRYETLQNNKFIAQLLLKLVSLERLSASHEELELPRTVVSFLNVPKFHMFGRDWHCSPSSSKPGLNSLMHMLVQDDYVKYAALIRPYQP